MPLLTVRAIESFRPKERPYKVSLDWGLQLRIAPDGVRTLLVRYTVKGGAGQRQYRIPQQYGEGEGHIKLAAACAEAARIRALAREGEAARAALGDLVACGPTQTNVNDFRAILVDPTGA